MNARPLLLLLSLCVACGPVRARSDGGLPEQKLVDGGLPPEETEPLPEEDAGVLVVDAGPEDSGVAPVDAGSPPLVPDAGTPPTLQYAYPAWTRQDLQPLSPQKGQTYGLEQFRGRTLVVVLLEGYCPYCRSNAGVAEQLQKKLTAEKRDVEIVVLGDANAQELVTHTALRVFHDNQPGRTAWEAMRTGAYKHDTFVFAPNGMRTYFWAGTYTGDAAKWTEDIGTEVRRLAPAR